jgi:hypothetical protein
MNILITAATVVLTAQLALGQTEKPPAHGYVFFSLAQPFDRPGTGMAAGGGGEGFLYKGLSLGADVAYIFPKDEPATGIGMFSVNPGYHFYQLTASRKVVPFVTGGYSLGFRNGVGNFFNYGGGVTYWFSERLGLRLELRDHRYFTYPQDSLLMFRMGLSIR